MATAAVLLPPVPRAPEASAAASAAEDYDDDDDDYDVSRCPICYERAACEPLPHATSSGDVSGHKMCSSCRARWEQSTRFSECPWCRAAPIAPPPKGFVGIYRAGGDDDAADRAAEAMATARLALNDAATAAPPEQSIEVTPAETSSRASSRPHLGRRVTRWLVARRPSLAGRSGSSSRLPLWGGRTTPRRRRCGGTGDCLDGCPDCDDDLYFGEDADYWPDCY